MKKYLFVALTLGWLNVNAAMVTVDFEGVVGDTEAANITTFPDSTYVEDGIGFSFSSHEAAVSGRYIAGNLSDYGSAFIQWCPSTSLFCPSQQLTIANTAGGGTIDLQAIDAIAFGGAPNGQIEFNGYYAAGGSVSRTIDVGSANWETFLFDSSWAGLSYITADGLGAAPGIDNVQLNAVPIPAAVWLFGSALAGLGWLRRRQTA
jgi:hypothetical protein